MSSSFVLVQDTLADRAVDGWYYCFIGSLCRFFITGIYCPNDSFNGGTHIGTKTGITLAMTFCLTGPLSS